MQRSSYVVPEAGLEPARLAALDFESSASADSATPAGGAAQTRGHRDLDQQVMAQQPADDAVLFWST
jgi:hypothetical protein